MRSLLDDLAVVDDEDHIRLADGGKPVRDDEGRRALHQRMRRFLNQHFRFGIDRAGCFIQHKNLRLCDNRARKRDELLFSRGEPVAAFADIRVIALFKLRRDAIRADGFRRFVTSSSVASGLP